jgi:hypothetical protein
MQLPDMQPILSSAGKWRRVTAAPSVLMATLLLSGFTKPQLDQTIYDGVRHSTLIEVHRWAYAHVGMTKMSVVTDATGNTPDGT